MPGGRGFREEVFSSHKGGGESRDVALGESFASRNLEQRLDSTASYFFEPASRAGQCLEQRRVDLLRRLELPVDNDPHLDATAFNFHRDKMRKAKHRSRWLLFAGRRNRYLQRDSNALVGEVHACDQLTDCRRRFGFGPQPLARSDLKFALTLELSPIRSLWMVPAAPRARLCLRPADQFPVTPSRFPVVPNYFPSRNLISLFARVSEKAEQSHCFLGAHSATLKPKK